MQIRKKGGMKLKKSSSLKLLSQSQPNFAEMILGWPPSKIVSGDPDFQPRLAAKLKIEKRGDEILIVHCCFSVSQNELKF